MQYQNNFSIKSDGKMFLDEVELRNVKKYELVSSAGKPAELTLKIDVKIDQVASEPEK